MLRAKVGEWALERWSYPDYRALRDSTTGMAITGWARESIELGERTGDDDASSLRDAAAKLDLAVGTLSGTPTEVGTGARKQTA